MKKLRYLLTIPLLLFGSPCLFANTMVNEHDKNNESKLSTQIINIMPTGNSLTQASDPGYRGFLYHMLDSAKYQFDFVGSKHDGMPTNGGDPDHSGFGGYVIGPNPSNGDDWDPWKHGDLLYHLDNGYKIMNNNADVMVIEIGINDFFNDRDNYDPSKTGADRLDSLLSKIYKLSPEVVLLVSNLTPVNWDANFGSLFNSEVPAIIAKYKKLGRKCYPVNLRKDINWKMSTDITSDQLHPTAAGYKKMANLFFSKLVPILDSINSIVPSGNPPIVSLTEPTANESFSEIASIRLTASASDPDGQIRKVSFYNGAQKLGELTSSPFSLVWNNVLAGNYTITAVAVDNNMNSTSSAPVNIQVKGSGKIIYQENFDDNLAQNWVSVNGSWKPVDGKYIDPAGNGVDISIFDANPFYDYVYTVSAKPNWNNNYGVVFNYVDKANYYLLELDADPLTANLKMVHRGIETTLKSANYKNGGAGIFSTIEVTNTAAATSIKVNNELVFDKIATNQFPSGKVGLYAWWNPLTFDNVQVIASQTTSFKTINEFPDLKIFPNPVKNGQFTIKTPQNEKIMKVELFNNHGKVVFSKSKISDGELKLSPGCLKVPGVYFVRIFSSEKVYNTKLQVY